MAVTNLEVKLPDASAIDLNKPVSFTYPEGLYEAAAVLDFLPDDKAKLQFALALSRQIQ